VILYFLRHGDAGPYRGADDDATRELTAAGVDALVAGAPLWRSLNLRPDVVLASPLTRARHTAELFVAGMGLGDTPIVDERLSPGAGWGDLARAMAAHPDARRVMFVGHQPDLSGAIALLTGAASVRLRPGGVACVEFPGIPEPDAGELAWLLDPDAYRGAAPAGTQVTRVAAYALCVDDTDRILLARLTYPELYAGWWTLPGGGIDFGEMPTDAVRRELTEETGLTGEVESLAGVESWARRGPSPGGIADEFQAIQIIYRVRVIGGTLTPETDGSTDEAAWFTRAELAGIQIVGLVEAGLRILDGE
jgi:phosphohistidine phosphatase SixA/ADP-ribose pyrophosphatase YjhB (NUDIX family)